MPAANKLAMKAGKFDVSANVPHVLVPLAKILPN